MQAKAKLAGHAIHPMLVVFPLGLLAMAVIFDVIKIVSENSRFAEASFYMIAAGILSGLVAAIFGWVDYFGIPNGTRAKTVALRHGIGNILVMALFSGSWLLRWGNEAHPPIIALLLAFSGAGLAMITGWLGGELVEKLGVSVAPDANVNAPSSLKPRYHAS